MKRCRHLKKSSFNLSFQYTQLNLEKKNVNKEKKKKHLPVFKIKLTYYHLNALPLRHKRLVVAKRQNANIGDQAS